MVIDDILPNAQISYGFFAVRGIKRITNTKLIVNFPVSDCKKLIDHIEDIAGGCRHTVCKLTNPSRQVFHFIKLVVLALPAEKAVNDVFNLFPIT